MVTALAFENSGTDSRLPAFGHSDGNPPNPSIVSVVENFIAPWEPSDYPVWLNGILHRIGGSGRLRAWMLVSPAVTATSDRATAGELSPPLPAEILASITEFVNLPHGWDGYDGRPVQSEVAEHACRFMAAISGFTQLVPDVVPLSDGGMQLEWFVGAYEVEVVIAPDGTAHVYFECTSDGRIKEFSLDDLLDTDEIEPLLRELHP